MELSSATSLPLDARTTEPNRRAARWIRWIAESRSHRVFCLVAAIWILNVFDLLLTLVSQEHGLLHEINPVARQVLSQGTISVMLYKAGLVLIGTYPLLKFRSARITELGALVVLCVYAFLAIRWSTCVDLYTLATYSDLTAADFAESAISP